MAVISQPGDQRLLWTGDRVFILIRCLVLVLMAVLGMRLGNQQLFPPTSSSFALIWWGYAAFAVINGLGLLLPALSRFLRLAFIGDLLFLSALTVFSAFPPSMFYPLFLLPTVWASIRRTSRDSLITGVLAAVLYTAATFLYFRQEGAAVLGLQQIIEASLNAAALVFISWLTSTLAARSSEVNQHMVEEARRELNASSTEAAAYRDRTRALYEVAFKLGTTMSYQAVLDTTTNECLRLVNGSVSIVLLSTGELDELYVAAGQGLRHGDLNRRIQIVPKGVLSQTFGAGTARIIEHPAQHADIATVEAVARCSTACCVPLSAGRRNYGILLVGSDRATAFNDEELGMVAAMANYAIIAMLNAQLVQELREERTKLISKEEEVRQQLSRDLHDGPAQSVAAITMNIEFVKRLLERDPPRVQEELTKMGELARRTTYDIRTLLFELRPLALDSQGLLTTIREYVGRFKDNATQVILEENNATDVRLDSKREGTVFNIIQESVNNALKHAQAKHIWIRLIRQGDELLATVQDDGKGFDLDAVKRTYNQRGSFGLLNIEERARIVGGSAEMQSAPGAGTTVRVIVPLDSEKI